jgi:hypothetical protein
MGAEIPAWGGNSGPPEIFIQKIPSRNSGPLQKVAPQLGRKDLAKIRRARNSGFSEFPAPSRKLHHSLL